ncbi:MAG: pyruvate, phosphate dikinase [Candidatus Rokubacteria bacterium]|nr:pyruvate, phosphate dikinase [Candidatus Rokubacteria bacterium]
MGAVLLLDWTKAADAGPDVAGGKGWNLGRLHRFGFPVPRGGVLPAESYRRFLYDNRLTRVVESLSAVRADEVARPDVRAGLDELGRSIEGGSIGAEWVSAIEAFLEEQALIGTPVAVRSSATTEDAPSASSAGLHRSCLNVVGAANILQAIKACYASLWTPHAVAYRRTRGVPDEAAASAVVILEMVPAECAGVAFSCDPRTGRTDLVTVSANFGLGESVVSGATEPDEYQIAPNPPTPRVIARRIGRKKLATGPGPTGGTVTEALAGAARRRAVLSDEMLVDLTLLVMRVHDALGEGHVPQDVEWAHDGRQFYVLQARPVTGLPRVRFAGVTTEPEIWSDANLRDVMPGVQSTLGWTILSREKASVLLGAPFRAVGYPIPPGLPWIRLYHGRAYFNLSALQWAFFDALGLPPADVNRAFGGHQPEIRVPPVSPMAGARGLARALRRGRLAVALVRCQARAPRECRRVWRWVEAKAAMDLPRSSDRRLQSEIDDVTREMDRFMPLCQLLNVSAGAPIKPLSDLLERHAPRRSAALINNLLAASNGVPSADPGYRLLELATLARHDAPARSFFTAEPFDAGAWRERLPLGSPFRRAFDRFLAGYGHRGVYESEIMNPRWGEDPTYLLAVIRIHVLSDCQVSAHSAEAKRRAAEEAIARTFRLRPEGLVVRFLVRRALRGAALREMAKSSFMKLLWWTRQLWLEAGRRLVERRVLAAPEDVFLCSRYDVISILTGRWDGSGLGFLIDDRRRCRERDLAIDPPHVIIGEASAPRPTRPAGGGSVLSGLGVAGGSATGRARLIKHPAEGHRLEVGEVLVAPSTDPAWTPLFLRASALVTEVGGYLSHGAIVAREYGLPAVVNVPAALEVIEEGEELTVDGDAGKVYRRPVRLSGR